MKPNQTPSKTIFEQFGDFPMVPMAPVESDDQFLDRCAIAAMQGIYSSDTENAWGPKRVAEAAYETAEAMLAERTKRRANRGT